MSIPEVPQQPGAFIMPTNEAGKIARIWLNVGPAGVLGIMAFLAGGFMMFQIREGQNQATKSQEQFFLRLDAEGKDSRQREEKLLDRSDRQYKESYDRWDKAKDRSDEVRNEVKAINTKVDGIIADVKMVNIYLKLQNDMKDKEKGK